MLRWLRNAASKTASADRLVTEGLAVGDNAGAIAAFEAALRLDPDHVGALRRLGLLEANAGRSQTGLAKLEKACRLQSQGGVNHYARHQALLGMNQTDAAVDALVLAVACSDAEPDWQIELGLMQERMGRAADALSTWRGTVVKFPDQAVAWWNLARALAATDQNQDWMTALSALDRAAHSSAESAFALALFLQTEGPVDRAEEFYAIALEQNPEHRAARLNLGAVRLQRGDTDGATVVFAQLTDRYPDWTDGWLALGSTRRIAGQLADAERYHAHAVAIDPQSFSARVQYAITLEQSQKFPEAEEQLHTAISQNPNVGEPHLILGNVLAARRLYDEAEAAYWRAVELGGAKGDTDALLNLSSMLHQQGRFVEGAHVLEELLRLKPDTPEALGNLGVLYRELRRTEDAERYLKRALELKPDMVGPHVNLANLYGSLGRNTEAEMSARAALAIEPDNTDALLNLGNAIQARGRIREFVEITRRVLQINPTLAVAWSNLLLSLNYSEETTPAQLLEAQREFAGQFDPGLEAERSFTRPSERRKRKLRIGYVSPDFRRHVVAFFIEPVLQKHDRNLFDVYCYFTSTEADATTRRIRDLSDVWRELGHFSFDDAERVMLADELDVVIDLAGHTARNLLPVLARRVAPVQVTWLGYPSGTGVASMDWRITDRWADPAPDADPQYVERLYRLPEVFLAFRPDAEWPSARVVSPHQTKGYVTFGSFNNFVKISDVAIRLWAAILAGVPGARLAIKTLALRDEVLRQETLTRFEALGFDISRLDLLGPSDSHHDHLTTYSNIDIALDTFPYHGTTTTCEALWMGVPVVTLAGDRHAARVGVSLLTAIGCEELIGYSPDAYIAIAVALAHDPERIALLRRTLRQRLAGSSLGNVERLTRQVEAAYLDMHAQWLAGF